MADILSLVFRTFLSQTDARRDFKDAPPAPAPAPCGGALVLGDHISRSLLLLAAVTAASELGMRVVFFTQTQIQSLPAPLQKRVPSLSPESLKKIKFSYPKTVEDLLQQVASLHESTNTCSTPPSLIIVDRLEGYLCGGSQSGFHPGEQSCAAHLSALLCDTAAFLTQLLKQRSPSSAPCRVIASFQSAVGSEQANREASATDPALDVLDRYFQIRCTLDQDMSYEAAASGLQEVWHVYLSGTSITDAPAKDSKDGHSLTQEWKLLIYPDGLMEFKMV